MNPFAKHLLNASPCLSCSYVLAPARMTFMYADVNVPTWSKAVAHTSKLNGVGLFTLA